MPRQGPVKIANLIFIFFYFLIFEGFPNRALVYPDRGVSNNVGMHEEILQVLVNVSECKKEKCDVDSAKGKGAWRLLLKGSTPKL